MSSRTHQEELRRRNESQPVQVIDYSKLDKPINESAATPVNEPVDKPVNKPEWKKIPVPSYVCACLIQSLR